MDRYKPHGILIVWITIVIVVYCDSDGPEQITVPIGAYRIFPKTSFSCLGRPAGYYADIETGCQVYHMCDGLGRQFSYSCPNTTLFQQRMLICDHWYMVNCSRAESDYAANLLIGQRDKPFVPEEENQLRTPRPDLLDRPYAPDYSGESFRNQYKQFPSIQNQITDYNVDKFSNKPSSTRWRIQQPSTEILPPSHPPIIKRRNDEADDIISMDLGTSFSSNYNTSADISVEQAISEKSTDSNIILQSIKIPSKLYEPPFLYPILNENYTAEPDEEIINTSAKTTTPAPFMKISTPSTTIPIFTRPSTFAGRPFTPVFITSTTTKPTTIEIESEKPESLEAAEASTFRKSTYNDYDFSKYSTRDYTTENENKDDTSLPISTTTNFFTTTLEPSTTASPKNGDKFDIDLNVPKKEQLQKPSPFSLKSNSEIAKPSKLILPPFPEYVMHDIATTQGPPIYYEWKIPSNALEPPKLDPPIGVDGRKEDDYKPESSDSLSTATSFVDRSAPSQPRPFSHNPFLAPIVNKSQRSVSTSVRTPTSRSIQQRASSIQPNSIAIYDTKETNKTNSGEPPTEADIEQLRKDFHIPDFLFPLENDARTGYEHSDTVNSFQIKIPERRSNTKRWYGENSECPECHPSFVKPGTCEPCVKRR